LTHQQTQWGHRAATWVATGFGVGRAPVAPGTFGALLGVPLYLVFRELPVPLYAVAVLLLFAAGVWVCGLAERQLNARDHESIVFDEIVGVLITLWLAPSGWAWLAVGFGLFRLFDIWKPFPIRRLERWPGGWGVMADDALAGVYGFIALQLLSRLGHAYFV
jgi:phosphatidylglycerophosphatase A